MESRCNPGRVQVVYMGQHVSRYMYTGTQAPQHMFSFVIADGESKVPNL